MLFRSFFISFIVIFIFAVQHHVYANPDQGLYDPVAPKDAAFVRFIYADAGSSPAEFSMNGKSYGVYDFQTVSPYFVAPKGRTNTLAGAAKDLFLFEPGRYYTVALFNGALEIIEDDTLESLSKALIQVYNFTSYPSLALKTTGDAPVPVLSDVGPGQVKAREINAVKVAMEIVSDDDKRIPVDTISLDRRHAYAVMVFEEGSQVFPRVIRANTDTTR